MHLQGFVATLERHPLLTGWGGTGISAASILTSLEASTVVLQFITALAGALVAVITLILTVKRLFRGKPSQS